MFFYDKKIRYLNYYENGIRLQNAGYVKFEVRDYVCQMLIYIKGPRLMGSGEARIWFLTKTREYKDDNKKLLGTIMIRSGQGRQMLRLNAEDMGETGLVYRQIAGIRIELQRQQYLECNWESEAEYVEERKEAESETEYVEEWKDLEPETKYVEAWKGSEPETEYVEAWKSSEPKAECVEKKDVAEAEAECREKEEDAKPKHVEEARENESQAIKWEVWKATFSVIHPLDERECLKLTPRDLEILPEEERVLMHNSFLLHGFYNYRHLILWKEKTPQGMCCCLGIPGVFHEREKILAKMFGFDYFWCQSKVPRSGSFGYYYRYVFTENTSI